MKRFLSLSICCSVIFLFGTACFTTNGENLTGESLTLFVGTYTSIDGTGEITSDGIYALELNSESGELYKVAKAPYTLNPSFIAVHPSKRYLYAVNETKIDSINGSGILSAFTFDTLNKHIEYLNSVSSEGAHPCHISINKSGNHCFVANYSSGNVAMFPIGDNGFLEPAQSVIQHFGNGPHKNQKGPHAHMILPGRDNVFFYAADLGTDSVYVYRMDKKNNKLISTGNNLGVEKGSGPRHFAFHPIHSWMYIVGELNGTVTACKVNNSNGSLTPVQTISTLIGIKETKPSVADIHITPDGKFLYVSNRGKANTLAIYSILPDGKLDFIEQQSTKGEKPRNFAIDPTGSFLLVANQNSDSIIVFRINKDSGKLTKVSKFKVNSPVCIKFL